MKRKNIMLSYIAAFAIAAFVGIKTFESNASGTNGLIMQNVEALAANEDLTRYRICYYRSRVKLKYTYYDCGTCEKVYDEKGIGEYSKCFY